MSRVRSKDTAPELVVRRLLHSRGYRYRLHRIDVAGRPDLVLPKYRVAIFVNGCFWHGHSCALFRIPATRTEFWLAKIAANRTRDSLVRGRLREEGWRTLDIWECALRGPRRLDPDNFADQLIAFIAGSQTSDELAERGPNGDCGMTEKGA